MKKKKFKDLLTSVDILNTLSGGVSEPFVSMREEADRHEVRVRVPGIDKRNLQAEIHNNELIIFYMIPMESNGREVQLPQIIYNNTIPYFVEISGIQAHYEDDMLVVELPFNEFSSGFSKRIKAS
ncbi:MAG TPA: Hsp20/alpha crystallin family protein [Cyclobacteriaceae bacterium]|nr:Hsp20/alpha crystallin family protein [Cyclobacteriaceae bacterium]